MLKLPESRWKAFAIHLAISVVIFFLLSAVIYFLWYPEFLFETEGGWQGIRLIAGVDLVIGPLLTLIVYNKAKKSIRFDLSVIAGLQVLCIIGGMATVAYSRPLVVAYADGTFYTANREKFEHAKIDVGSVELLRHRKPVWLSIDLPKDPEQRAYALQLWDIFRPISVATELYLPYSDALKSLQVEGLTSSEAEKKWNVIYPAADESSSIRLFKLETRFQKRFIAVDVTTGEYLDLLEKT